jgi:kumamolisin
MRAWGNLMNVTPGRRRVRSVVRLAAGIGVVAALVLTAQTTGTPTDPRTIAGPYSSLLSASADLGPSRAHPVQVTAALHSGSRPAGLIAWAGRYDLSVRWRPGDHWAVITGARRPSRRHSV